MIVYGVDPGLTGAIAMISGRVQAVADLLAYAASTGIVKRRLDAAGLTAIVRDWRALFGTNGEISTSERVGAMLGQGVVTVFALGSTAAVVEGTLLALGVPIEFAVPSAWKRALVQSRQKEGSQAAASRLFPRAHRLVEPREGPEPSRGRAAGGVGLENASVMRASANELQRARKVIDALRALGRPRPSRSSRGCQRLVTRALPAVATPVASVASSGFRGRTSIVRERGTRCVPSRTKFGSHLEQEPDDAEHGTRHLPDTGRPGLGERAVTARGRASRSGEGVGATRGEAERAGARARDDCAESTARLVSQGTSIEPPLAPLKAMVTITARVTSDALPFGDASCPNVAVPVVTGAGVAPIAMVVYATDRDPAGVLQQLRQLRRGDAIRIAGEMRGVVLVGEPRVMSLGLQAAEVRPAASCARTVAAEGAPAAGAAPPRNYISLRDHIARGRSVK